MTEQSAGGTIGRLLVIGTGMVGGSVLRSAHARGLAKAYSVFDTDADAVERIRSEGFVDHGPMSLQELAPAADIIVLAVPPMSFSSVWKQLSVLPLNKNVLITDVASVKQPILQACSENAPELLPRFVPGHPIAGSEQSGWAAANTELFAGKKLILTPHAALAGDTTTQVQKFWSALGSEVVEMGPELHDEILASTSHLPHVLAFVLVDCLLEHPHVDGLFEFAAGGFASISRTASSDSTMWHDIFFTNKEAVLRAVESFESRLAVFKKNLQENQSDAIRSTLVHAKRNRDAYLRKHNL